MIVIRRSDARGHAQHGWLDSFHTFSFADYHDPAHMGFRALRVINEDRVQPSHGFGTHPHRDMEIISYVLEGALQHQDSMGNGSIIRPGDVQRMSAGTGVLHSEKNPSPTEPVHFLQIWVVPSRRGLPPSYAQRAYPAQAGEGLRLIASPDGAEGSLSIHADARLYKAVVGKGERLEHSLGTERHAWVQVVRGGLRLGDQVLYAGDGAALSGETAVRMEGLEPSELLVFDLA